jgi:hypothetical protein
MAIMYSELTGSETQGEKALYNRFKNKLSDEFLIWHNYVFHSKSVETDFIIFHPSYGIWTIEVKDWLISQIEEINSNDCKINKDGKIVNLGNPFHQSRNCWKVLKELLENKTELLHKNGIHMGKLIIPINYAVAFYNITEKDIRDRNYENILPLNKLITADMIKGEGISEKEWEKKILSLREKDFDFELSLEQINTIKAVLGTNVVKDGLSGLMTGTLDDYQEKLVKDKIERQIVIEGPAGSGKSIVLLKRAILIKKTYPSWVVGIICFNAVMANYLKLLLSYEEEEISIDVYDVYEWVKLYLPNVKSLWEKYKDPEIVIREALSQTNNKVERIYDALLIDEGQDSSEILLKLYRAMLNRTNGSFTFCFDKRQSLYTTGELVERLNEFGFKIDNDKELIKQQRSILVILALAYYEKMKKHSSSIINIIQNVYEIAERFFSGFKQQISRLATGVSRFFGFKKDLIGLSDLKSELYLASSLKKCDSIQEMIMRVSDDIILSVNSKNASFADWLVIYPIRKINDINIPDLIKTLFIEKNIPFIYIDNKFGSVFNLSTKDFTVIGDNRRTAKLNDNAVKIMTIHASKGFEAQRVAVLSFDSIGQYNDYPAELGYVAITRGKKTCNIYYVEKTHPVQVLEEVMDNL